jgi:hypothetical protein
MTAFAGRGRSSCDLRQLTQIFAKVGAEVARVVAGAVDQS